MKKRVSIDLNISAEEAWRKAGEQFGDTGEWTSQLTSSYLDRDEVGVGATRVCRIKDNTAEERITNYDPDRMTLTYELITPPSWVISALNTWTVESRGPGRSTVSANPDLGIAWWMLPMTPLLSLFLNRLLKGALEEFKHWAETGTPHPRKQAHSKKNARWRTSDILLTRAR